MITSKKRIKHSMMTAVIFFMLTLLILIITMMGLVKEKEFYENAEQVAGFVNNIQRGSAGGKHHKRTLIYISYWTEQGECFYNIKPRYININTRSYSMGDRITVFYDVNNPYIIGVGDAPGINFIKILFGVVLIVIDIKLFILFLNGKKQYKKIANLVHNGIAVYVTVKIIKSIKKSKSHYCQLDCQTNHPITGEPINITSTIDAALIKENQEGAEFMLMAYFDPLDKNNYFVELES